MRIGHPRRWLRCFAKRRGLLRGWHKDLRVKYLKNSDSFLLLETMLAVTFISVALISILHLLSYSVAATRTLRDSLTAATLIENKIWEFEKDKETKEGEYSGVFEENEQFAWKAVIAPMDLTETAQRPDIPEVFGEQLSKLNLVTVTVSWMADKRPQSLTIATYMRAGK